MTAIRLDPSRHKDRDALAQRLLAEGYSNARIIEATRKKFGAGVTHGHLALLRRGAEAGPKVKTKPKPRPKPKALADLDAEEYTYKPLNTALGRRIEQILTQPYTFELYRDEGGGWNMTVQEFKGCFACGKTPELALASMQRVVRAWLGACLQYGHRVPDPSPRH